MVQNVGSKHRTKCWDQLGDQQLAWRHLVPKGLVSVSLLLVRRRPKPYSFFFPESAEAIFLYMSHYAASSADAKALTLNYREVSSNYSRNLTSEMN